MVITTNFHAVRRAQVHVLSAPRTPTTVWSGDFIELDIPSKLGDDTHVTIDPRIDYFRSKDRMMYHSLPKPHIADVIW